MGSSKKHKEKKDKKKHKKARSRSRERDHKRSHKSSHRKDKRRSPNSPEKEDERRYSGDQEVIPHLQSVIQIETPNEIAISRRVDSDDEFDIDKLLDAKLPESSLSISKKLNKKRRREEAIEEFRKRNRIDLNEDSLEKFADEQLLEEHGLSANPLQHIRPAFNSETVQHERIVIKQEQEPLQITFNVNVEAPVSKPEYESKKSREKLVESRYEPQLPENREQESLSIIEANKLRAKLGLKPLEIKKDKTAPAIKSEYDGKKSREKLVDSRIQFPAEVVSSFPEADELHTKSRQKPFDERSYTLAENESSFPGTSKSHAKSGQKTFGERSYSLAEDDSSYAEANKSHAKSGQKTFRERRYSSAEDDSSYAETSKSHAKSGQKTYGERSFSIAEDDSSFAEANKSHAKSGQKAFGERKYSLAEDDSSYAESNKSHDKSGQKPSRERSYSSAKDDSSFTETSKSRGKSGQKSSGEKSYSLAAEDPDVIEANKLRAKLGLKPLDISSQISECNDSQESSSIAEANKLRSKLGLKQLDVKSDVPEFSEPQLSLSIAETNKLRAKLGLKPLDVKSDIPGLDEGGEQEVSKPAAEIFVKTENINEKKKSEALREKLKVMKEKRNIEKKLRKTKGIADSDSEDESAASWIIKHQKILQEKQAAEKRAKLLEEMDEEFGIGALVEEEFDKKKAYTSQNLRGLTIGHGVDSFKEGYNVILTLKDKGVLDEEEDVLENVNILDSERYAKNVENKKKKPDYKPYEEPEFDEFGILKKKNLLSKYDEEIEGEKKKSFKIGNANSFPHATKEQELELIRMKLKQQNVVSLEMPEMKMANEYLTQEDMVQFKKPKKKKKARKTSLLKADDLLLGGMVDSEKDFGSRKNRRRRNIEDDEDVDMLSFNSEASGIPLIDQADETVADLSKVVIDEDTAEQELSRALHKAKKLKERKIVATAPEKVIEILSSVEGNNLDSKKDKGGNIEMNSIAEFCRTLGDIPTYGMSGNRDEEAEDLMDLEQELLDEKAKQEMDAQNQGAWNEVDIEEKPAEISVRDNEPILEEEPDIATGIAGALKLATKKGYLDKETEKAANANRGSLLQAQSYTIEEKFYEDDKFGKRDRYTGPIQDFKEKNNYRPDVKLEYIDDNGRLLTAKEAFRYLSHKFHGKGPGKNKVDKRMKKLDQDTRLKQMSSTDTPLNTVKLLQLKQKETQSPYIVLSGGNKTLTQTMISKTKQP